MTVTLDGGQISLNGLVIGHYTADKLFVPDNNLQTYRPHVLIDIAKQLAALPDESLVYQMKIKEFVRDHGSKSWDIKGQTCVFCKMHSQLQIVHINQKFSVCERCHIFAVQMGLKHTE